MGSPSGDETEVCVFIVLRFKRKRSDPEHTYIHPCRLQSPVRLRQKIHKQKKHAVTNRMKVIRQATWEQKQ